MKQQHQDSEVTIGLDLGERRHRFCALDGRGEVVEEGSLLNDRASLARLTARYPGALAVMEAGTDMPLGGGYLEGLGCEESVSNPPKGGADCEHVREIDLSDEPVHEPVRGVESA